MSGHQHMEKNVARYRNIAGVDLYVVAVSKVVEDDGVFEVADDLAPGFDCQPSNYERLDGDDAGDEELETE